MSQDTESFNNDLYNLLKVRGYKPVPLNSQNQRVGASQQADVMEFTFTKDGEDYGKAWVSVDDASNLKVYFDDEQQESPDTNTPGVDYDDTWTGLLKHLKQWAQRRQLSFELANKDRLGDDMRQREYYKMKEKLGESYHPMGKKASYNDAVPNVKIVLQHNRSLEEGEARFRNVARIYLENVDGERFLAPTNKPGFARVYARHIAEGGLPNDEKWNHIKSICEDYSKMAGFVRATRNGQFNESAAQLVQEGIDHYNNLRETLHKLAGHRGYHAYFESWTPTLMEGDGEDISEMFMSQSLDPRIESAMPILSRLKKPVSEMAEVDNLAEWADSIISEKLELSEAEPEEDKPIGKGKIAYTVVDATGKKKVTVLADYPDAARQLAATHWGMPNIAGIRATKKEVPGGSGSSGSNASGGVAMNKAQSQAGSGKQAEPEKEGGSTWDNVKQSAKKNWNAPGDVWGNLGKLGAALVGVAESDLNEMDKESGSKRDFDNARGPDKTAKPISVKQFAKGAMKSLKRGMKGWEKGMHDVDTVKAATKSLSPDSKEEILKAKLGKGSPAELQQKLIKREKNKKVDEGTYPSDIKQYTKDLIKDMRREQYDWEPVDMSMDPEEAIDDAREQLSMFAVSNMCDAFGDFDEGEQLQIIKFLNKKFGGQEVEEGLDANQKRVGQLGPTGGPAKVGDLVGANESTEHDELSRIIDIARFKR